MPRVRPSPLPPGLPWVLLALLAPAAFAGEVGTTRWVAEPLALPTRDDVTAVAADPHRGLALADARGVLRVGSNGLPRRVLHRAPVHDLAFLPDGALLVASERGIWRVEADGRARELSPAPGAAARAARRIAIAAGYVALATGAGAYVSRDTTTWQRLAALPAGAVASVALRRGPDGGLLCWAIVEGRLWRTSLEAAAAAPAVRESLPSAGSLGDPLDVAVLEPGVLVVVFPQALALARAPGAPWEIRRPALPPGASALRAAASVGRVWLATDRGLLEAGGLEGPWRRAAPPLGSRPVYDLARAPDVLYAATADGLVRARRERPPATAPSDGDAAARLASRVAAEPPIERVHRAAIAYLELGPARVAGMRRGLARRGWLPVATFHVEHSRGSSWSVDHDQAFVSGEMRFLRDHDRDDDRDLELGLTLSWDFGDLAYHPEEIDVSREAREGIELRDDVLDEVNQLYFERRRALAELVALDDPDDPRDPDATRLRLRAAELAAGIDAWTGGWFGRELEAVSALPR